MLSREVRFQEISDGPRSTIQAMIREFFAEFLFLCFSKWANRFDLNTVEWLDQEVFPDPPEGSRHQIDLLARLRTKEPVDIGDGKISDRGLALIHIEIEAEDRTTRLKPRLPSYYVHLRDRDEIPVLPIVIYLKVGLDGIGVDTVVERFWDLEVIKFSYLYVGLPKLEGVQYVEGENLLGVALAALMRIPKDRIVWLGDQALRRLVDSSLTDQQRFLLADCVQAYLPLDETQQKEFDRLLSETTRYQVQAMNKTPYDKGMEKGREKGCQEGLRRALLRLGSKRFGQIPQEVEGQINAIEDPTRLEQLTERVLDVPSWDELLSAR